MSNINIHYDSDLSINLDINQCITNIFKILNLNPCTQINILFINNDFNDFQTKWLIRQERGAVVKCQVV